jgi:hypothetical protein
MKNIVSRRSWLKETAMAALIALGIGFAVPIAQAKQTVADLNITPNITGIDLVDGQLVASGNVTATVKDQVITESFSGVPIDLSVAENQEGAGACPILHLELGPINLNLLGLIVETSPICLQLNAYENAGLLGDLLCSVGGLLGDGLSLDDILGGLLGGEVIETDHGTLDAGAVGDLLAQVTQLLNTTLGQLVGAELVNVTEQMGRECAILNLELGPLNLNLLGLEVILDDCEGGPVLLDITAQRGQLLGNLLCGLLHGGLIDLGSTLEDVLGLLQTN